MIGPSASADVGRGLIVAGRYRLLRKLAEGRVTTVWEAHHRALDCHVALALVRLSTVGRGARGVRDEALRQFAREARAAAMLGSKTDYVVRIFDFGVDGGVPFLAMERLEGEDLGARLARVGALSLEEAAAIAAQTACALKKAHAHGVLHLDLQPESVFLARRDDEERVKLLDFGLARLVELGGVALPARPGGALHGMAPEVLTSHDVDHRADLWSFGVVLYRAVTGALPFDNESPAELVMEICTGAMRPVAAFGLDDRVEAFFARALRRDPGERFQHAEEMARAFAEAARVSWRPLSSLPPPPFAPDPLHAESASGPTSWPTGARRPFAAVRRSLAAGF